MKPLNFIVIKVTLCLTIGILVSHLLSITLAHTLLLFSITFIVFTITYVIANRQHHKTIWFSLTAYLLMISLGMLTHMLHNPKHSKTHYSRNIQMNNRSLLNFRIQERLKPSQYHDKYIVDLIKINNQSITGTLILNIEKDSLRLPFSIDDILVSYSNLESINRPLNPYQFNYKAYLEKQYIYHQVFSDYSSVLQLKSEKRTLFGYAASLRELVNIKLKFFDFKPDELAVINALILGQRQDMSRDIYESYVNAGAIHILAISGLHVGIILLLLQWILKPIERLKHGKVLKVGLIIILLWSFAIVAGLSASVTRAVTMFSLMAIAMNWKRPTNIYNTLTISIFILLLCKPMFLFDVGFQMSYLAVIAIVSIQPLIYNLWRPKWKTIDYLWQIFTVTIAAQFGVVPISLYYFHQFPSLFFVSNLAIIPFLGIILSLGILVIILALLNILPEFLAYLFARIISLMNKIVNWVSLQDFFLLKDISFDIPQVIISYVFIIASVLLYKNRSRVRLIFLLLSIVLCQGVWIYSEYKKTHDSFIIFHKSRYSLLGHHKNSKLYIYNNFDSIIASKDRIITNYSVGHFMNQIEKDTLKSVYQFQNKTLLVIDSFAIYHVRSFQPDYVLLRNSPRINLERMIDSISPKYIIADGSNYKSYIKRWEATCIKRKLPFHQTSKKGAFIIK